MALRQKSLFLYGYEITTQNGSIDFRATMAGPVLMATVQVGSYTLTDLLLKIKNAMQTADPAHVYTVTADRTVNSNTENRITISTSGTYLDLLFSSGPRAASSIHDVIGFPGTDQTGSTSYTGTSTTGTTLIPELVGYNYLGPDFMHKVFGSLSVSAGGVKEAITWQIQAFLQVEFKYEPEGKVATDWLALNDWMIQQKPFEFTPEYPTPATYYQVTLETTDTDSKGMGFQMKEMLPDFPFLYRTGMMKFRQILS